MVLPGALIIFFLSDSLNEKMDLNFTPQYFSSCIKKRSIILLVIFRIDKNPVSYHKTTTGFFFPEGSVTNG
jgi:hypothetical protein